MKNNIKQALFALYINRLNALPFNFKKLNGFLGAHFYATVLLVSALMMTAIGFANAAIAADGFVNLPKEGFANSAYTLCNTSGAFGLKASTPPADNNNTCAITNALLTTSPMNAPLEGFTMVGMISRGIAMPAPYAGEVDEVATLTDTIWRNKEKTECIYGTHLLMKPNPLADGQLWEVNDITRGGFAGRPVEVAYFLNPKPHAEYGLPEAVFRVGRTFTSVKHSQADKDLPSLKNAPANSVAITEIQAAGVHDNWVNFTTDVNAKDPDGVTRMMSSMLYIKTTCSDYAPVEVENAIRLRSTGQNGQHKLEISVPGLAPSGAVIGEK